MSCLPARGGPHHSRPASLRSFPLVSGSITSHASTRGRVCYHLGPGCEGLQTPEPPPSHGPHILIPRSLPEPEPGPHCLLHRQPPEQHCLSRLLWLGSLPGLACLTPPHWLSGTVGSRAKNMRVARRTLGESLCGLPRVLGGLPCGCQAHGTGGGGQPDLCTLYSHLIPTNVTGLCLHLPACLG